MAKQLKILDKHWEDLEAIVDLGNTIFEAILGLIETCLDDDERYEFKDLNSDDIHILAEMF